MRRRLLLTAAVAAIPLPAQSNGDTFAALARRYQAGARLPSLRQILDGPPPANSPRIGGGPTGLGLFARERPGRPPILYHYGVNAGFRSVLAFAADASFGIALNGDSGRAVTLAFCAPLFESNRQGAFPTLD